MSIHTNHGRLPMPSSLMTTLGSFLRPEISAVGTLSMMSTSPLLRAATRVGSDLIGLKHHPVPLRLAAPVFGIGIEYEAILAFPLDELVGAGADGRFS